MASYRYVPEWMQSRSQASSKAWETRWQRMWELGDFDKLGPKGKAYIEKNYGTEIEAEERRTTGGGKLRDEYYDDYENPFDIEIDTDEDPTF